jgi:hypothetical protein
MAPAAAAVVIAYCAPCGHAPWARALAARLAGAGARAALAPGAPVGAFEVSLERAGAPPALLWSKLATGQPVDAAGVGAVADAVVGELERERRRGGDTG